MIQIIPKVNLKNISKPQEIEAFLLDHYCVRFVMPTEIDFSVFNENITIARRIYKVGFLNEAYRNAYPEMNKLELIEKVILENDLFINARQFRIDAKTYNEKINYIFV